MHFIYLFCILVSNLIVQAYPFRMESQILTRDESSNSKTSAENVSQAVNGLARNTETVTRELNALPLIQDKKYIQDSARAAYDAASNQDSHRSVLAATAGSAGRSSSDEIIKFMPTVLSGLSAIMQSGTIKSMMENIPVIQDTR